jgi:hypothetical protein
MNFYWVAGVLAMQPLAMQLQQAGILSLGTEILVLLPSIPHSLHFYAMWPWGTK